MLEHPFRLFIVGHAADWLTALFCHDVFRAFVLKAIKHILQNCQGDSATSYYRMTQYTFHSIIDRSIDRQTIWTKVCGQISHPYVLAEWPIPDLLK